jgi:glutathione peroxidase
MNKIIFSLLFSISIAAKAQSSIYDFKLPSANGAEINFNDFRGKKILIVNTASLSEYAGQLAQLEQLYQQYKNSGFVIVAVPSNDFTNETKTNGEIASSYSVTFPVAAKASVTGSGIIPLYVWLTKKVQNGVVNNEIITDFQKFVIDSDGKFLGAFGSTILPNSRFITSLLRTNK